MYNDDSRNEVIEKFYNLRQQVNRTKSNRANFCLSDFVAPKESGLSDYVGGFLVTAGKEIENLAKDFEDNKDDYNSILVKSLGDRIAEALVEMMDKKVRTNYGGYVVDENRSN